MRLGRALVGHALANQELPLGPVRPGAAHRSSASATIRRMRSAGEATSVGGTAAWGRLRESLTWGVVSRYWEINGPTWAAALALRILLAVVPLILLSLILVGFLLDTQANQASVAQIARATPAALRQSVVAELQSLRDSDGLGVVSFLFLLWTGSGVFGCFESCLAAAYSIPGRSLKRQKLLTLIFVVLLVAVAAAALALAASAQPVPGHITAGAGRPGARFAGLLSALLPVTFALVTFLAMYQVLPNTKLRWRDSIPGSLFAVLGATALTLLWPLYQHFSAQSPSASRALLVLLVAVVTYAYLLAEIVVLGAVINAELLRRRSGVLLRTEAR